MRGAELTISSYTKNQYPFASSSDTHIIFDALQHPAVFQFLKAPQTVPPPELTRVLVRCVSSRPDGYLFGIAEHLIANNMQVAGDDESTTKEMLESFHKNLPDLLVRANFFYDILERDMSRCKTVPYVFYPLLYTYTPEQVANQLCDIVPNIYMDVQRIFFMLVFKFTAPNKKSFMKDAFDVCLLKWKSSINKKDDLLTVYQEAADGLWDYIGNILTNCSIYECGPKVKTADKMATFGDKWIAWMKNEKHYDTFLDYIEKNPRKVSRQLSIFKHFLWNYIGRNNTAQLYYGVKSPERKRLCITSLKSSDTP